MRCARSLVATVTTALLLTPAVAQATEEPERLMDDQPALRMEPRLVGIPGAALVDVLDAAGVGQSLAYLGPRRGERVALHWIDGASGNERRLTEARIGDFTHELEALGDAVVFTGRSARTSVEPWRSDGTKTGTRMLRDIAPGRVPDACASAAGCGSQPAGSFPGSFVTVGDSAYFTAFDPKHGRELWRTDGTTNGTRLVADISPGKKSGIQGSTLVVLDGEFYLAADDGRHGQELWRSDGTRAGTSMIRDVAPGRDSLNPRDLVAAGDLSSSPPTMVSTVGSYGGPMAPRRARSSSATSDPDALPRNPRTSIAAEDHLFFTARDAEHGRELWRTDGTAEGTVLVSDIEPGEEGSLLGDFAVLGDRLYFADWGTRGVEYQSDGTQVGTFPIGSDQAGAPVLGRRASESAWTLQAGGRLFFPADDGTHGTELWTTDGTVGGTAIVADLRPGPKGSEPAWLVAAEGYLYFIADDGEHGRQFWQLPVTDV